MAKSNGADMAKILKRGEGIKVKCAGDENMFYTKNTGGCGAILLLTPDDIFEVSSMVPGGEVTQAFCCPQCKEVSNLKRNRIKK